MFPGILEEIRRLIPAEHTGKEPGFQSLGYPEALACVRGEVTTAKALLVFVKNTLAYAKRQATWFRNQVQVEWIPAGAGEPAEWADRTEELLSKKSS